MLTRIALAIALLMQSSVLFSQINSLQQTAAISGKFIDDFNKKATSLDDQLSKQTQKYLQKIQKEESRLEKYLWKADSLSAKTLFSGNPEAQYAGLLKKFQQASSGYGSSLLNGQYQPYTDSLNIILSFLKINPKILSSTVSSQQIQGVLDQLHDFQSKIQNAETIRQFIEQRKLQLTNVLSKYNNLPKRITNSYKNYSKQLYYYNAQIKSYKDILNNPDKQLSTALTVLNKLPAFSDFAQKNSILSGVFNMPVTYDSSKTVQGLATREQVATKFKSNGGGTMPNVTAMVQQNGQAQSGQDGLSQLQNGFMELKNKLSSYGIAGSDADMPSFTVNDQKAKKLGQRLEYGIDLQTVHSNYYFPITTDIGLSAGYKLGKDNVVGVGISYKIGFGSDIRHINISSQGASMRSFVDIKIKKTFFVSGGIEYNYQQPFYNVDKLKSIDNWQQSGLIGISQIINLKTKLLKKSKVQLLWDVLSYRQHPQTQPLKFRIGYAF